MAINAIGNGIPFPKGKSIPSSIKKAMVLWYDLKRQGATNETMAANPKLIDLSGNGHDATCYNFAWRGMSGIEGYYFTGIHEEVADGQYNVEYNNDLSEVTLVKTNIVRDGFYILYSNSSVNSNYHTKIRVTGLNSFKQKYPNAYIVVNSQASEDSNNNRIEEDGTYEFNGTSYSNYVSIRLEVGEDIPIDEEINITVEQLPLYPNAIVFDGVDDYTLTENLPQLNDYTIVAKRKIIDTDYYCVASMSRSLNIGPFILECSYTTGTGIFYPNTLLNSFGTESVALLNNDDITFMTPQYYNNTRINKGNSNETNYLVLGARNIPEMNNRSLNGAIYSFILFDRTLTTKEINWVKTNLIEGDLEL